MKTEIARSARNTIGDGLRRSARRDPEKTAIIFGDRSWTYAELDDATSRAANVLLEKGLQKGDRVAAYGRNSDAYVILWLACAGRPDPRPHKLRLRRGRASLHPGAIRL